MVTIEKNFVGDLLQRLDALSPLNVGIGKMVDSIVGQTGDRKKNE